MKMLALWSLLLCSVRSHAAASMASPTPVPSPSATPEAAAEVLPEKAILIRVEGCTLPILTVMSKEIIDKNRGELNSGVLDGGFFQGPVLAFSLLGGKKENIVGPMLTEAIDAAEITARKKIYKAFGLSEGGTAIGGGKDLDKAGLRAALEIHFDRYRMLWTHVNESHKVPTSWRVVLEDVLSLGQKNGLFSSDVIRQIREEISTHAVFFDFVEFFKGQVSEQALRAEFSRVSPLLSESQKLSLVLALGGLGSSDYNDSRRDDGPLAKGSVDVQTIFNHAKNTIDGDGGVCRDISSAQGQVAQWLGFKDVYIVTKNTSGSLHSTVLFRSAESGAVYHVDYSHYREGRNDPGSLRLDKDISMDYHIHLPAGGTVGMLPSQMRLAYERAMELKSPDLTGITLLRKDPLAGIRWRSGSTTYGLATAYTADGVVVIAMEESAWGKVRHDGKWQGKFNLAFLHQNQTQENFTAAHLNFRLEQGFRARFPFALGEVYVGSKGVVAANIAKANNDDNPFDNIDPVVQGELRVGARVKCLDDKLSCRLELATNPAIGLRDARDVGSLAPYLNLSSVLSKNSYRWSKNGSAELDLFLARRFSGLQGEARASVIQKQWKGSVGVQGNLATDSLQIAPGTERVAFCELGYKGKNCEIKLQLIKPEGQPLRGQFEYLHTIPTGKRKSKKRFRE